MESIDRLTLINIKDRKVLFVRSKKNPGTFYSLGGKRELGETDAEALAREVKEEVGADLVVESLRLLTTITTQAHGKPEGVMVHLQLYQGDVGGEIKPSSEIVEIAWFTTQDKNRTGVPGGMILDYLRGENLID